MKGDVAPYAVFIVIFIGISLFLVFVIAYQWVAKILPAQGNEFSCRLKLIAYCKDWWLNEFKGSDPGYKYSDTNPKTCEKFTGVSDSDGPSISKCKERFEIK